MALGIGGVAFIQKRIDWMEALPSTAKANQALRDDDFDAAEQALNNIADIAFPPVIKAQFMISLGRVKLGQGLPREALQHFDQAEKISKEYPSLDYLRAVAHERLGNYETAVRFGRRFVDKMGDDADAYWQIGHSLAALERLGEAAEAFRNGLDDNPGSIENVQGLRQVLPRGKKAELRQRYALIPNLENHLKDLVAEAREDEDEEALEMLATARNKLSKPGK